MAGTTVEHAAEAAEHGHNPLEQFVIKPIVSMDIGGLDISFTNSSLWMMIALGVIAFLMVFSTSGRALVPGRMQSVAESLYEFIHDMVRDVNGPDGMKYFPFILALFLFVLFSNMLGMIPYAFTTTSHIVVTFALASAIFISVTVLGFIKQGPGFLKLFVPSGLPLWLLPLLVLIEVISYISRPVTLSLRLFANMMAGHTMLKVLGTFVAPLGAFGLVPGLLPILGMVAITGLEVLIAFLQAYVFAILTCIYLNDALHEPHH